MSPVFVIVQTLPQHPQNFVACHHVVGQVRDVRHLRAGWTPGVIRGRLSDLNTSQVTTVRCLIPRNRADEFSKSKNSDSKVLLYLHLSLREILDQIFKGSTYHWLSHGTWCVSYNAWNRIKEEHCKQTMMYLHRNAMVIEACSHKLTRNKRMTDTITTKTLKPPV